jgi:hypothetical protein
LIDTPVGFLVACDSSFPSYHIGFLFTPSVTRLAFFLGHHPPPFLYTRRPLLPE